MQRTQGQAKSVRDLLNARFDIDYYQREYLWEQSHVSQLVGDLATAFLKRHRDGAETIAEYERYFLGSIIISEHEGRRFIVDGQQRLTTITLLLIQLYRNLKNDHQKRTCGQLIFSYHPGRGASFNLDVDERHDCMKALFDGERFDEEGQPRSVANILRRYEDIGNSLAEELRVDGVDGVDGGGVGKGGGDAKGGEDGEEIPAEASTNTFARFADWMMTNVDFVEITAGSDGDAYAIFETMNDRGLSLSPADMLKSYLLSGIDRDARNDLNEVWKKRVQDLCKRYQGADADAIKAWLVARHADPEVEPAHVENMGEQFHRWVRDHHERLRLVDGRAFGRFIERDFEFYGRWFGEIVDASWDFGRACEQGLEVVYRNREWNFRHRYELMMSALRPGDDDEAVRRRLRAVGAYIDILVARYAWSGWAYNRPVMYSRTLKLMAEIREADAAGLASALEDRLGEYGKDFPADAGARYDWGNGRRFHRLLAHMMDYVDRESWAADEGERSGEWRSRYAEYLWSGYSGYEVEHVQADRFRRDGKSFGSGHQAHFQAQRNRIGGLLLVPGWVNNRVRDKKYPEKRSASIYPNVERRKNSDAKDGGRNLLVLSLIGTREECERDKPGFCRFAEFSGLPFFRENTGEFTSADVDARQALYAGLARRIWNVREIRRALEL